MPCEGLEGVFQALPEQEDSRQERRCLVKEEEEASVAKA